MTAYTSRDSLELHREIVPGQLLGEGGMGRVLDGFAPDLRQHLAIKQLRPEWMEDAGVRARFEEEALTMASIDHPGVLPVFGIGLDADRRLFYAMKKVGGRSFTQWLADAGGSLKSVPRRISLLGILLDVCETMAAAHEKGIVHRDLKPDNILVDDRRSVYVIDWGLAKTGATSSGEKTLAGKIMGTPGYMAPEQAEGHSSRAGPEADVFALGVILYEILTGIRPFAAKSDHAEMLGTIHQDPAPPRRINWLLPRDLNAVCMKALRKDPQQRYPTARHLADDLRAHLEGAPVSVLRPNVPERIRFAARRQPMRALLITAAVISVIVFASFIAAQRWIDHRLADKAMARLAVIDSEIRELETEAVVLRGELEVTAANPQDHQRAMERMEVNQARWILAQFEAHRVLNSVTELRFIRKDPAIVALARQRLVTTVEESIERRQLALGQAVIATLIERSDEGMLTTPLTSAERKVFLDLSAKAAAIREQTRK